MVEVVVCGHVAAAKQALALWLKDITPCHLMAPFLTASLSEPSSPELLLIYVDRKHTASAAGAGFALPMMPNPTGLNPAIHPWWVSSSADTMQLCQTLQVGDVGLAQLAHQRGLVTLLLDKCCVTDAGTAHLAGRVLLIAISLLSTWKSVKTCMRSVTPVTKQSLGACL